MNKEANVDNIYRLDGKVPLDKAVPFGLQHILAMFVANIAPIIIVAGASGLDTSQSAMLIQRAMVIAGIGTLIQLFPLWKIGWDCLLLWESALPLFRSSVISDRPTVTMPSWALF